MSGLTKANLRTISQRLKSLRPPGPRPLTVEELVEINEIVEKVDDLVANVRAAPERGDLVLEWRVPSEWTAVKSGKGKPKWMLGNIKKKLEDECRKLLETWKKADLCLARRRRWVQVRRFSTKKPDRPNCADCLGARQAIDTLKDFGVIVDDSPEWTVDDTKWFKCAVGQTHIVIRVFEVTTEGRYWPEPACIPPPKPERKRGPFVESIVGSATPKKRSKRTRRSTTATTQV